MSNNGHRVPTLHRFLSPSDGEAGFPPPAKKTTERNSASLSHRSAQTFFKDPFVEPFLFPVSVIRLRNWNFSCVCLHFFIHSNADGGI